MMIAKKLKDEGFGLQFGGFGVREYNQVTTMLVSCEEDALFGGQLMSGPNYKRTLEELRDKASMFWPSELSEREAKLSVIPKLLETQEQFIAILSVDVPDIEGLFQVVNSSRLPGNLFVKHLVVLADFGGEMLQRISSEFESLFPSGRLDYLWNGVQRSYHFKRLPGRRLSNATLAINGRGLIEKQPLDELHQDAIAILMRGSACVDEHTAGVLAKCEIGNYLGRPDDLEKFIRQRYIWVSRITGGARANNLGQIAQEFVGKYLKDNLQIEGLEIGHGRLPGVSHADPQTGRLTQFDFAISDGKKCVAVEVSFQVTTNSTIERKGGQARSRFEQIERAGHKIAYVIDGAGNFTRETPISTLCAYSHCTVAFSQEELTVLCAFIEDCFADNSD